MNLYDDLDNMYKDFCVATFKAPGQQKKMEKQIKDAEKVIADPEASENDKKEAEEAIRVLTSSKQELSEKVAKIEGAKKTINLALQLLKGYFNFRLMATLCREYKNYNFGYSAGYAVGDAACARWARRMDEQMNQPDFDFNDVKANQIDEMKKSLLDLQATCLAAKLIPEDTLLLSGQQQQQLDDLSKIVRAGGEQSSRNFAEKCAELGLDRTAAFETHQNDLTFFKTFEQQHAQEHALDTQQLAKGEEIVKEIFKESAELGLHR